MRLWRFIKIDDTHKTHITFNISVAKLILIKFLYILVLLHIGLIIFSMCSFLFLSQLLFFSWWFVYAITLYMNGNIYNSLFAKNLYGIMKFFIELFWEVMFFMIFNVHILVGGVVAYTFMVVIDLLVLSIDAIPFFYTFSHFLGSLNLSWLEIVLLSCSISTPHIPCLPLHQQFVCATCSLCLHVMSTKTSSWCQFVYFYREGHAPPLPPPLPHLAMKPLALSLICLSLSISIPFFESSTIAMVLAS
jgi:hypothetical protein